MVGSHIHKITEFDELTNHYLSAFVCQSVHAVGVLEESDLIKGADVQDLTESQIEKLIKDTLESLFNNSEYVKKDVIYGTLKKQKVNEDSVSRVLSKLVEDYSLFYEEDDKAYKKL